MKNFLIGFVSISSLIFGTASAEDLKCYFSKSCSAQFLGRGELKNNAIEGIGELDEGCYLTIKILGKYMTPAQKFENARTYFQLVNSSYPSSEGLCRYVTTNNYYDGEAFGSSGLYSEEMKNGKLPPPLCEMICKVSK